MSNHKKSSNIIKKIEIKNKRDSLLLNAIPDIIFLLSKNGEFIDYNAPKPEILFMPPEKFLGRNIKDVMPKSVSKKALKAINDLKKTNSIDLIKFEYELNLAGEKMYFEARCVNGKKNTVIIIIRNITDQKKFELKLQKSEEIFHQLAENINQVFYVAKQDYSSYLYVSPAYEKIWKKSCSSLYENPQSRFNSLHPADKEKAQKFFTSKKKENYSEIQYRIVKPNNEIIWIKEKSFKLFDKNKTSSKVVGIIEDITEIKNNETALLESEQKFKTIFENATDGILVADIETKLFLTGNKKICEMLGYSLDEIRRISVSDIHPKESLDEVFQKFEEQAKGNITIAENLPVLRKDRTIFYADISASPIFLNNKQFVIGIFRDISERKTTTESLAISEKKHRDIFENAPVGIYQSTYDGKFIIANNHLVQILGYDSIDDLLKVNSTNNIYWDTNERQRLIDKYEAIGFITDFEIKWRRKNGEPIWISLTAFARKDKNNKTLFFEGYVKDITKQKKADDKLIESEKRYRIIAEETGKLVYDYDIQSGKIIWSGAIESLTGFSYDEFQKTDINVWENLIHPDDKEKAVELLNLAMEKLSHLDVEYRFKKKDGSYFWVEDDGIFLADENGKAFRMLGTMGDISYRKAAEEQFKKLYKAMEQSPASIIITDVAGRIEYVNSKFSSVTGFKNEEVLGRTPRILKSGKTPKEKYVELWENLISGNEWRSEILNRKKNGELFWEAISISPIKNENNVITHFLGVQEDITEKKKMEVELKKALKSSEEANRLKSVLLANISHELRTPMNGIIGFANILKDEISDSELNSLTNGILKSSKRLMNTLNAVLSLCELESGSTSIILNEINIVNYSKYYLEHYEAIAKDKGLTFNYNIKEKEIFANADENLFKNIITNLVDNAIKFTESGGITITISSEQINDDFFAAFKVTDTGIGISSQHLDLIFEEFRQVSEGISRTHEGSGLGLNIAKKMSKLMRGDIFVKSTVGVGSEFMLILPSIKSYHLKEEKPTKEPVSSELILNHFPKKTILCVEDNLINQEVVLLYLKDFCKVDLAADGMSAIKFANEKSYSLILMDINLGGGIDGISTAREIMKIEGYKQIPFIAITGYALLGDKERLMSEGFSNYIAKPYSRDELISVISKELKS